MIEAASMKRMGEHSMLVGQLGQAYLLAGRGRRPPGLPGRRSSSPASTVSAGARLTRSGCSVRSHRATATPAWRRPRRSIGERPLLALELEMRPLWAQCELGLGTLFRRAGQRTAARQHLAAAIASFRALDMPLGLEQARTEPEMLA